MARILGFSLFLATITSLAAAPVPVGPAPQRLPKGATARLGSLAFRGPYPSGLAFSADDKTLIASDGKSGFLRWDAEVGALLPPLKPTPPDRLIQPSSIVLRDSIVWAGKKNAGPNVPAEIVLTDISGAVLNRFELPSSDHVDVWRWTTIFSPSSVSPDGRFLSVVGRADNRVSTFDVKTGAKLHSQMINVKARPMGVTLGRDCKTLFVMEKGQAVRRYEAVSGKELPALERDEYDARGADVSPDGKWIVSIPEFPEPRDRQGKYVDFRGYFTVHSGETGKKVGRLPIAGMPNSTGFLGSNAIVTSSVVSRHVIFASFVNSEVTYCRWSLPDLKKEWEKPGSGARLIASHDGKTLASHSISIETYDAATGQPRGVSPGHTSFVGWVSFAPDGKSITSLGGEHINTWTPEGRLLSSVHVRELATGRILLAPTGAVQGDHVAWVGLNAENKAMVFGWDRVKNAVAWRVSADTGFWEWLATPDGKRLIVVRNEIEKRRDVVSVVDLETGKRTLEFTLPSMTKSGNAPRPITLSADGKRFFSLIDDETILVTEMEGGTEAGRLSIGPRPKLKGLQYDPHLSANTDGSMLAVADRGTVRVFDVRTGTVAAERKFAAAGPGGATRFSPDGKRLAVWRERGPGVSVWEIDSKSEPRSHESATEPAVSCVAFSPDGRRMVVGYQIGTSLVWDVAGQ